MNYRTVTACLKPTMENNKGRTKMSAYDSFNMLEREKFVKFRMFCFTSQNDVRFQFVQQTIIISTKKKLLLDYSSWIS